MIRTCNDSNVCTRYYCPSMCRAVSTNSTKRLKNLESKPTKYSSVLAPTSSMLFLARPMSYRTSHVPSIVELFTRSEAAYPSVTAAVRYCHEPLLDGNVCRTTQYGQAKSWLSLTACLSIHDQQDSRHCYYKAHCCIRALGSRTLRWNSSPQTVRTELNR